MGYDNLIVEEMGPPLGQDGGSVVRVTINRPQAMNALNPETMHELQAVADDLESSVEARVVIVTGAGDKAFVAGADIKGMIDFDENQAGQFAAVGHRLADSIAAARQVWIAAVNGFALGGGCELALACDFAYASERARFGQPEVNLALIPGFGGTTRLARRVGVARALEMVTTGMVVGADEALRMGLVNRVVPADRLMAEVEATARTIAAKAPLAVMRAKRAVRATADMHLGQQNELEIQLFSECFNTDDQKEGMRAFIEKRPAVFRGN